MIPSVIVLSYYFVCTVVYLYIYFASFVRSYLRSKVYVYIYSTMHMIYIEY